MEGVTDQLVNTAGASEQYPDLQCLRKLLDTDREEAKQAKLSFPPAEKTALRAKLQQERRVKLLGKGRRQSSKRPTHRTTRLLDHRRNSTKRARRSSQTNLESISSRRLSKSDPCHRTNQGEKRSLAAVPGFPNAACTTHILSSWSTRPWECKRNHEQLGPKADSDVASESRLELAGKQAFENFISIDGQAAAPKVVLEFGKPMRYPEKLPVGPRRTFRQKAWSSAAGEHLSKLEAACTYFLLAASDDRRALSGIAQDRRTKFVERTRALEIGAASIDAAHKRDPRRQMSNVANLSRMQHVRWWLGFGANRLFCQRFTVITQLPTVVLDDNSGLTMHLGSGAGVGRHNFLRQGRNAGRPSGIRQLGKPDT